MDLFTVASILLEQQSPLKLNLPIIHNLPKQKEDLQTTIQLPSLPFTRNKNQYQVDLVFKLYRKEMNYFACFE